MSAQEPCPASDSSYDYCVLRDLGRSVLYACPSVVAELSSGGTRTQLSVGSISTYDHYEVVQGN